MIATVLVSYFLHQVTLPGFELPSMQQDIVSSSGIGVLSVEQHTSDTVSVAPGSQRVPMLIVHLTASCQEDVTVSEINLTHGGLGSASDIIGIYAVSESRRIADIRSFDSSDQQARLRFRNFTIEACETAVISILADISADAAIAGEHTVTLRHPSDIHSSAYKTSIEEPEERVLRRTVGTTVGMISYEALPLTRLVRYGSRQVVARFRLTASGGDDHSIHAITFTNLGSATNTDLRQLFVQSGRGKVSATTSSMRADIVRIEFDPPLVLQNNDTRLLELRADVRSGRSRTINFTVEQSGDIEATPIRGRR